MHVDNFIIQFKRKKQNKLEKKRKKKKKTHNIYLKTKYKEKQLNFV